MIINLPNKVTSILNELNENKYEAYIVGGCVRDSILGRTPHDWDICTSATPDQIISVFRDYRVIETGLKHGTVTVVIDKEQFEITTYRIDGEYSDNRRPDNVKFTTNINEDLSRRDFTINAMAYNPAVGLIDPYNGMYDIDMRLIRCVGDSDKRFKEDSLRIIRAIRFAIQLNFRIVDKTYFKMRQNKHLIKNISNERINSELVKMLDSNKLIANYFDNCKEIIEEFIPEFSPCFNFNQNNPYHEFDVYNHILHAVDNYKGNDMIIKLALLLHDIGKPECYSEDSNGGHFHGHSVPSSDKANSILKRLKFDNDTIKNVTELVLYHDSTIEPSNKTIKRWLNKIGEVQFRRLMEVRTSDMLAHSSVNREERLNKQRFIYNILDDVLSEQQCFALKDLNINGKDLISIGFKEGKHIGVVLNELLDSVLDNKVENNRDLLLKLAVDKLNGN